MQTKLLRFGIAHSFERACLAASRRFRRVEERRGLELHGFAELLVVRFVFESLVGAVAMTMLVLVPGSVVVALFVKLVFARHYLICSEFNKHFWNFQLSY